MDDWVMWLNYTDGRMQLKAMQLKVGKDDKQITSYICSIFFPRFFPSLPATSLSTIFFFSSNMRDLCVSLSVLFPLLLLPPPFLCSHSLIYTP